MRVIWRANFCAVFALMQYANVKLLISEKICFGWGGHYIKTEERNVSKAVHCEAGYGTTYALQRKTRRAGDGSELCEFNGSRNGMDEHENQ